MLYRIHTEKQKNTWTVLTLYSKKQVNLNLVLDERHILEENSKLLSLFPVCLNPEKPQSTLVEILLLSLPSIPSSNWLAYSHGSHASEYPLAPASISEANGTSKGVPTSGEGQQKG